MAGGPGRRARRKIDAVVNPPVVLNLPADFNNLTVEEYAIFQQMLEEDSVDGPTERLVPLKAPPEEKIIFSLPKSKRTRNEKENVRNWQLKGLYNNTGDVRAESLFLQSVEKKSKRIRDAIDRCEERHRVLMRSIYAKREEVRQVGGTPLPIPAHFDELPALLK